MGPNANFLLAASYSLSPICLLNAYSIFHQTQAHTTLDNYPFSLALEVLTKGAVSAVSFLPLHCPVNLFFRFHFKFNPSFY